MKLNLKNAFKVIASIATATLLLMSTGAAFAESSVASVSGLTGYATVTNADGEVKRVANGDELNEGDVLNTGADSAVSIVLANGETLTIGQLESYTVSESVAKNSSAGDGFAQRSLNTKSPSLSTATSAGGGISAPTTPAPGGSPTN